MKGKHIVIGITGSIAAYKIPNLVRMLVKEEAEVKVIMTPAAKDFVTPLTLATLSMNPVITEPFNSDTGTWNNHVELGQWADVMLFAPVTANTLGKMVSGIADNFLVTSYLSAKCPVFIAPAMDLDMYLHPTTQRNIQTLREAGNIIIEPQTGELASGLSGPGRMEEPQEIIRLLRDFLEKRNLFHKKKVLVTAGPTHEPIDPVMYIGNHSSGTMGFALAEAFAMMGANVSLITGPTTLPTRHPSIVRTNIQTASELREACLKESPSADIIIMAAAVADYAPETFSARKIKKTKDTLILKLKPTRDILSEIAKKKRKDQILVGFALETEHERKNAMLKLQAKKLDYIVLNSLNDPGAGFGITTNKVTIFDKQGIIHEGTLKDKHEVALDIINAITRSSLPKKPS